MPPVTYQDYPKEPVVLDNLTDKMMRESVFVPLEMGDDFLKVAMADPEDFYTIDALRVSYGLTIEVCQGKKVISLIPLNDYTGPAVNPLKPLSRKPEKTYMIFPLKTLRMKIT